MADFDMIENDTHWGIISVISGCADFSSVKPTITKIHSCVSKLVFDNRFLRWVSMICFNDWPKLSVLGTECLTGVICMQV